ncbi:unnamed protein product [Lymnaea stagnalis]|uniref:THD domain-containing protein n=1 Tax=Lymnaea stagnalis TaxID=6523 RepID=A0AAV2H930_LYMST
MLLALTSLTLAAKNIKSRNTTKFTQINGKNVMTIKLFSLLEETLHIPKMCNFSLVAVHKKLNQPNVLSGQDNAGPVFSLTEHFDTTLDEEMKHQEIVRGSRIVQNGINIQYTGLYYIYSSLKFASNVTGSPIKLSDRSWFHYVHRISPNSPMNSGVLLRAVHTICPQCNKSQESTYTGGIFHLTKGDTIKVCLSGLGIAGFSDESSYFGMFMLHSEPGKP